MNLVSLTATHPKPGAKREDLQKVRWLRENLYDFAIELRQLAYTMPAGSEDRLVRLSERIFRYANEQTPE